MALLYRSTAYNRAFKMIDGTDHLSAKTGMSLVLKLSKNGAAFANAGGTTSEIGNGWYLAALNTTDTNTFGDLAYYIIATGTTATNFADDTDFVDQVVNFNYADGTRMGLLSLPNTTPGATNGVLIAGTNAATTITTALTTTFTGNVTGSVGSVAAGGITAASIATDAIDADALAADAVTEIWAKACTEPTAVVAASPTVIAALSWLLTLSRNTITQTATTQIVKADDTTTTIATSTVSDDSTTFTRGEFS